MTRAPIWITIAVLATACPKDKDDDSADTGQSARSALCSGDGCVNDASCPTDEPGDGDPCTFAGNCHYCSHDTTKSPHAEGYTCDGTSFTYQGTYDCNP